MTPEPAIKPSLEKRVDSLESLVYEYIRQTNLMMNRMEKNSAALHDEMQDFIADSKAYREASEKTMQDFIVDEKAYREASAKTMQDFIVDSQASREASEKTMQDFIADSKAYREASAKTMQDYIADSQASREASQKEMKDFKDEMGEFKERMEKEAKRMSKQWGDLANKMGTLVEDIVIPAISHVAYATFGFEYINDLMARRWKTKTTNAAVRREFDVIAVCGDFVMLNETKSTASKEYIEKFIAFLKSKEFYEFFPEYKDKKLIPIFSSLYLPPDLVDFLTENGIFALAMNGIDMEILNYEKCRSQVIIWQQG